MLEKVIVIGSNSFSGAHFVNTLLNKGHGVIGISRSEEPNSVFLPYRWKDSARFRFEQLDLNHHLSQILSLIRAEAPDYVVNFAAQSMVAESWRHPEHWFRTNTLSAIMLHEGLRNISSIKKYVHISTPEVYGHCEGDVDETHPFNPSTPYAVSRAAADMSLKAYVQAYQFPVVTTRAANVYGPGQQLYRIIPKAVLCFLTKKKLHLHGGGISERSFIHIEDVAEGTYRAMIQGRTVDVFHFATPEVITIRSLVQRIADLMGVSFEDWVETTADRLGKDTSYRLDTYKARTELNWEPGISLEHGLRDTIRWVSDHIDILRTMPDTYQHKP